MDRLYKLLTVVLVLNAFTYARDAIGSPNEILVPGPGPLPYGAHAESDISTNIEVDNYTFAGVAGQHVRGVIAGLTGGFHPNIVLRDPGGNPIDSVQCNNGGSTCSTLFEDTLPTTGTYTINVSQLGLNHTGNYSLHLDQSPPPSNWVGIGYGTVRDDSIDHASDSDYYAFAGAAVTTIEATFAAKTGGLHPHLEIWSPGGSLLSDTNCNNGGSTCVDSVDLALTETGIYRLGLSQLGYNHLGDYTVGVSCLFGSCPDVIPNPVPEPQTYLLMLIGILSASLAVRRRVHPAT